MLSFLDAYSYQIFGILIALFLACILTFLILIRKDYERSDTAPWNDEPMSSDPSGLTKTCMFYNEKEGAYYFRRKITAEAIRAVYF